MSNEAFGCREESSITTAWAKAFLHIRKTPNKEIAPFALSVHAPDGIVIPDTLENPLVKALDACLIADNHQAVDLVAFTIFPDRIWKLCNGDRKELYKAFTRSLRAFTKWEPTKNRCGMYFGRLVAFGTDHKTGKPLGNKHSAVLTPEGNQLEHIITQLKKSVEQGRTVPRMQLQAAVFDPFRDTTTTGQPSFPCMQHLAFAPDLENEGLAMTAFYATQQMYKKAFGNWLGLCRLGTFVAGQAGLRFTRFTCYVGVQKMDKAPMSEPTRAHLLRTAELLASSSTPKKPAQQHA